LHRDCCSAVVVTMTSTSSPAPWRRLRLLTTFGGLLLSHDVDAVSDRSRDVTLSGFLQGVSGENPMRRSALNDQVIAERQVGRVVARHAGTRRRL
jgi:hypothetical protein